MLPLTLMYKLTPEQREGIIFWLGLVSAKLALFVVLVVVGVQIYVRWAINKDFTFLGGFELEALTVSAFALVIALVWAYRSNSRLD